MLGRRIVFCMEFKKCDSQKKKTPTQKRGITQEKCFTTSQRLDFKGNKSKPKLNVSSLS